MVKLERLTYETVDRAADLAAQFRVTLKSYKGISSIPDVDAGKVELTEYLDAGFPVFCAVEDGRYIGYLVCRAEEPCVWVESIYVIPEFRRRQTASLLFAKAEELAESYGGETVYNCVHPNNTGMIDFLKQRGYNVLNLIEIRKPYTGERLTRKIKVDEHSFDY